MKKQEVQEKKKVEKQKRKNMKEVASDILHSGYV